jgi:cation transport ATPase
MMRRIQEGVSRLQGVKRIDVNPHAGSMTVCYDPRAHEDFHARLAKHADNEDLFALKAPELTEIDELEATIEQEAEFLAAHSETALAVVKAIKALNHEIREASGNTVDLKVLLPASLAIWAFFKAGADMSTPLWVTLGIFSFNSFIALHHAPAAMQTAAHEVIYDEPKLVRNAKWRAGDSVPGERRIKPSAH